MGYYSEVVIALSKQQVFKDGLLTKTLPKLLKRYPRTKRNDCFYWFIEDIKWYDSYPEIGEVDYYLDQLGDEKYGFIRIGEESFDYEHRGSPWNYDIYLNCSIEFPEKEYQ